MRPCIDLVAVSDDILWANGIWTQSFSCADMFVCLHLQTTSFLVPVWVLAALRLLIALYFAAEVLIERFTSRGHRRPSVLRLPCSLRSTRLQHWHDMHRAGRAVTEPPSSPASCTKHCCGAANGLGRPEYVWVSFFTDWTFCVFGASGLLGFVVTLWRMAGRSKAAKVRPDAEHGNGSIEESAAASAVSAPQAVQHAGVRVADTATPPPADVSAPAVDAGAAPRDDTLWLVRRVSTLPSSACRTVTCRGLLFKGHLQQVPACQHDIAYIAHFAASD